MKLHFSAQMTHSLFSFLNGSGGSSRSISSLLASALPTIILFVSIPFIFLIFCTCLPIFFNFIRKRKPRDESIDMVESNTPGEIWIENVPPENDEPPAYDEDLSLPPGYEEATRLPQIEIKSTVP